MRKAKTCSGCPAREFLSCRLGYETETYELGYGVMCSRPLEICHKPRSVKEFYERLKELY